MSTIQRRENCLSSFQIDRVVTASDLSRLFSVSERTVYRYVATWRKAGVKIMGDPGFGYLLWKGPMP